MFSSSYNLHISRHNVTKQYLLQSIFAMLESKATNVIQIATYVILYDLPAHTGMINGVVILCPNPPPPPKKPLQPYRLKEKKRDFPPPVHWFITMPDMPRCSFVHPHLQPPQGH
jgi:hypothetical protein